MKINSSKNGWEKDKDKITEILLKNAFPRKIINDVKTNLNWGQASVRNENDVTARECRYFKLPYIGSFTTQTKIKLKDIATKYCKSLPTFRVIFTSSKLGNFFSVKPPLPEGQISYVVYKFSCANCNVCYIGETTRNFFIRVTEHLSTDETSVVYKHLHASTDCKNACDQNCFSIIDRGSSAFDLKIKEAHQICKQKPDLNKQVKSIKVSLVI